MKYTPNKINRWMLFKLPAAWLTGVRLSLINEGKCEVKVRFKWINQNPYRSMFWAVQAMAAELTTGMLLTKSIQDSNSDISMLLVSNKSSFYKKAVGKITFVCDEGEIAKQLINSTIKNTTSKAWFKLKGMMKLETKSLSLILNGHVKKEKMDKDFYTKLNMPVIAAPLFLISGPKLVIECCKKGIVGTFPALNQRTSQGFEEWVVQIKDELSKFKEDTGIEPAPFGVNLIVHPSNIRIKADLDICVKHKVPLIITSLGAVPDIVNAVHSYGGLVFHDIIKKRHAEKAAEANVDGLVLVTAGAGGHSGLKNPMAMISLIKKFFKKTIILSGSISNGRDIASALQMGADIAYMGTRFINTKESMAEEEYKEMIINSSAEDIVYTAAVSGVHANFLRPSLEAMGVTEDVWNDSKKIDFGKDMAEAEAKAWKTIWSAGHGVSSINDNPTTKDLVDNLKKEFIESIESQKKNLDFSKNIY
jgi:nitronate monooxygenase